MDVARTMEASRDAFGSRRSTGWGHGTLALLGGAVGLLISATWLSASLVGLRLLDELRFWLGLSAVWAAWSLLPAVVVGGIGATRAVRASKPGALPIAFGQAGIGAGWLLLTVVIGALSQPGLRSWEQPQESFLASLSSLSMALAISALFLPLLSVPATVWGIGYVLTIRRLASRKADPWRVAICTGAAALALTVASAKMAWAI